MKVALLDHSMGNMRSVAKALEAAGAEVQITADVPTIEAADALCVPGQGIFGRCMTALNDRGLTDVVRSWIASQRPYLGICLGMQILFSFGEESDAPGLGVVAGRVTRIEGDVVVPHIGWNEVISTGHPRGCLPDGSTYFYFDHTYVARVEDGSLVTGWTEHGERFAASIRTGSVTATQFHPEKSGEDGILFLKGWVAG